MAEETWEAEPFIDGISFGEGPRWHEGRLWFSDFYLHRVCSVAPGGDLRVELEVEAQPSGLGWLPDGRLLVVAMKTMQVLRREPDGTLVEHGDVGPWSAFLANDMVVSADGRAYVGNFGFDLDALMDGESVEPKTTSLVRVDPDGSAHEAAAELSFPNGSVIFPDGKTLVVGESLGFRLTAFDVAPDGSLANQRVWAQFPSFGSDGAIAPDGSCLDAEGCIWVANALGAECVRVAEGGEVRGRVRTSQPSYACMLGGEDRRTLYCLTAPSSHASHLTGKTDGRVEQVRVEVPGAGLP